jgi:ATP/ADP translocase
VLLVSHNLIDPQLYVSLDYESRFIGKEIIGLFVNRFGKSSMAALLLLVTNLNGSSPMMDKLFVQALSVSSFLWLFTAYPLAHKKEKSF